MSGDKAETEFDFYYVWLGIPPEEQPPHLYRLLDVRLWETDPDVIDTGFQRRMAYLKGIKAGAHLEEAEKLKDELAQARRCLLNSEKRSRYVAELKPRLSSIVSSSSQTAGNDVDTVIRQLAESGLIDARHLQPFVPPAAHPKDASALATELVKNRRLTPFQAERVAAGRVRSLILGSYTLLDQLGEGGMGRVYKALHRRMHRTVALKMLPPERVKDPAALARFNQETAAVAKLSHPNIVAAHDADEADGVHFLVTEFVDGTDLATLVKQEGPLEIRQALDFVCQAAKGLEYAHAKGVVHRDVKPANLLVDKKGAIKLLDLGLARLEDSAASHGLTGVGTVMGTVDYMSPEQATSTQYADARSDVYSLGCTLYYLLTGRPVYDGDTAVAKLAAHGKAAIPSLCAIRSDCSAELDSLFRRLVAKHPADRPASMKSVLEDLDRCRKGASMPSLPTPIMQPLPQPTSSFAAFPTPAFPTPMFPTSSPIRTPARAVPVPSSRRRGARARLRLLLGGVGVAALLLLAGVIFMLRTKDGTLVVEVSQAGATVHILDPEGKVEITQPGGGAPLTLSIEPGKHRLQVEKQGFQFFTQEFEIAAGQETQIKAELKPKQVAALPKPAPTPGTPPAGTPVPAATTVATNTTTNATVAPRPVTPVVTTTAPFQSQANTTPAPGITGFDRPLAILGDVRYGPLYHVLPKEVRPIATLANSRITHFDVSEDLIYARDSTTGQIKVYSLKGDSVRTIAPENPFVSVGGVKALPQRRLAIADVEADRVVITDENGKTLRDIAWTPRDTSRQRCNMAVWNGSLFVAGMSNLLFEVNLTDYSVTRHSLNIGSICLAEREDGLIAVDYDRSAGVFSISTWKKSGAPVELWRSETIAAGGSITGLTPVDGKLLLTFVPSTKGALTGPSRLVLLDPVRKELNPIGYVDFAAGRVVSVLPAPTAALNSNASPSPTVPPKVVVEAVPAVAPFDTAQARDYQEAWAKKLGTTVTTTNSVGMRMLLIPPGEFLMGSNEEQIARAIELSDQQGVKDRIAISERPQHAVTITKPVFLGATEVTLGQFKKFIAESGYRTESETRSGKTTYLNAYVEPLDDLPVTYISWNDANAFCRWLSQKESAMHRLPTEAEWEFACRGGTTSLFFFGDGPGDLDKYAWHRGNSASKPHPVGTRLPNPFGLYDLYGSVGEWCQDGWSETWYQTSPTKDPCHVDGETQSHVLRGGWLLSNASICRNAHRFSGRGTGNSSIGFRIARVFEESPNFKTSDTTSVAPSNLRPAGSVPPLSPCCR